MIRKIFLGLLLAIVLGFAAYLFAWPYDYKIRFQAATYPGVVGQTLQTWSLDLNRLRPSSEEDHPHSSVERVPGDLNEFRQIIRSGDPPVERIYRWSIDWASDSTSRVSVKVSEPGNRVGNRLRIPFAQTELETESKDHVRDFYEKLSEHLNNFRVRVEEVEELSSTYTAYIPVACRQDQKAAFMMRDYPYLTQMMIEHNIQTNGIPFVEITRWNQEEDSIHFNFCYPIIRSEKLPIGTELKYKRFFGGRALKATYNGNYIFSDRAWYALRKEAQRRGLEYEEEPVEFFFSNPNFGGDHMEWKAEIYLPIKDSKQ